MQMHESKNLKAHITKGRGSFITKLLEIMKKYPDTIGWTPDGKRLVIRNIRDMEQNIINKYYRHRNINSFVRQLNMYYFRKLETEDKNQMLFENENFTQGNDDNFHLIQRRNKKRDQIIDAIMKNIEESQELSPETKNMVIAAIQYQQVLAENLKKIKQNLKGLNSHMKKSRGKQVKEALQEMRKSEEYLQQLLEMGKDIEEFVQDKLKSELRQSNQAKNNPMASEYNYDGEQKRMFSLNSQRGGNQLLPFLSYNSNFSFVNSQKNSWSEVEEEEASFVKTMMKNPQKQNDESAKQEQSELSQNEKQSE